MESEAAATHDEIWDDSALVESWNQALEEYKKYHSIHAKGGTIDDLADGAENLTQRNAKPETGSAGEPIGQRQSESEEAEADETVPMDESDETSHPPISDAQTSGDADKGHEPATSMPAAATLGPQTLLGTVQDEELKKLLMSWYYAGYYTGLFEGRQQGLQQAAQARKSS